MRKKTITIVLAACNALILYNLLTYDAVPDVRASIGTVVRKETPPEAPSVPKIFGVPLRIGIPSIAVDADVEKVSLAADGSMGVPKDPLNAAWYELGPHPGEIGNAVIVGHVNWIKGATGVFADLRKLKPGDVIDVQDDGGAIIAFVVRERRKYDAAADATGIFVSHDGKAHLNLITCDGSWVKSAKQYSERLVVFADKIEE